MNEEKNIGPTGALGLIIDDRKMMVTYCSSDTKIEFIVEKSLEHSDERPEGKNGKKHGEREKLYLIY